METKTHWKRLINLDYIGAYSLEDGKDLNIKIKSVKREFVTGSGGKKEECTVAQIEGNKPFIINRTNGKMIQRVLGSPFIEDWQGKTITVYATTTKVAGEEVECLRVRPTTPKAVDYTAQIKQLRDCKTIEELQKVYCSEGFPTVALVGVKDEMKLKLMPKSE